MRRKTFLISGGTNGIGFHTAFEIAKFKTTVIIIGKNPSKGQDRIDEIRKETGNNDVHYINGDLASQKEIKTIVQIIERKFSHIDVLINNAGIVYLKRFISVDGIEKTFAVNHLAYFYLTGLLLPIVLESHKPRIINVASSVHKKANLNFNDIEMKEKYDGKLAYRQSKLCNILFSYHLASKLKVKGINVNCVDPGFVNTGLGLNNRSLIMTFSLKLLKKFFEKKPNSLKLLKKFFEKKPKIIKKNYSQTMRVNAKEGAETSIYLATGNDLDEVTGQYYHKQKPLISSELTYDKNIQKKLWDLSERYTNFSYRL